MSAKSLERNLNGSSKNIVKVNRQPFMNCYYKSVNYIVKQNGAPKQNERKRLHDLASSNPRSFWHEIRRLKQNKSKECNVSLQAFYEHFSQVYSENSQFVIDHVETFVENNFSEEAASEHTSNANSLDMPISQDEVIKAISKLKRNKSPGLDLLPPELFIDAADLLCGPICTLFNHIFSNSKYPESWTRGVLVPVPKKGDLSDANNYRGITLTSIFSKLYSHILDNRLRSWAEENNIINEISLASEKIKVQ